MTLFLCLLLSSLSSSSPHDRFCAQVIVPLYVARTVLTSCGWPLMNSVLNDYTLKKHRAKFNSMQSIAGFG